MDYSKIKLANERNSHVTKRLNRLNAWQFFKVVYRDNIWRLFAYNFLMLICIAPIFLVMILGKMQTSGLEQQLPMYNSFGFSTGVWTTVGDYLAGQTRQHNIFFGWLAVAASALLTIVLSGGLAVIRDAFWTGKLSAVGIFKSMGKGIKANFLYAFVCTVVIAFSVFGIYAFNLWVSALLPLWATIILTVLLCILDMFLIVYMLILCSVSVTYKQTVYENLDDSWRLLWLNVFPNIIHFVFALIPVALYFLFSGGLLQTLFMVLMLMFGGMYFPLVWQTHMMKTFALFHPIEMKKKKHVHQSQKAQPQPVVEQVGLDDGADSASNVKQSQAVEQTDEIATDVYALNDDVYGNADDGSQK